MEGGGEGLTGRRDGEIEVGGGEKVWRREEGAG